MHFDFNEEQRQFRDSVARFLADGWTRDDVRAMAAGDGDDAALWTGLSELGMHGALVGEEYGGLGLDFVDLVLVLEEFGNALTTVSAVETAIAAWLVSCHGTIEQKKRLLPKIAAGELRFAVAHMEAGTGYDPEDIRLSARKSADGYVLNGTKILVAHTSSADCLLVTAACASGEPAIFLHEDPKTLPATAHVTLDPSMPSCSITFSDVTVSAQAMLGDKPSKSAVNDLMDASAFAAAATATGIASTGLDMAVEHAKTRIQFGKPIGSFQAIKHKCADMAVALDTARTAIYFAAWALSESPAESALAASMAKAFCGDASRMICNESLQIHGGMGFTWEYDLHLYLRRAKVLEALHGNSTWHRERIAGLILSEDYRRMESIQERTTT